MRVIRRKLERLDEHGTRRKVPFAARTEINLCRGHRDQPPFTRAVRPERHDQLVWHQSRRRYQSARVDESPSLGKARWYGAIGVPGHVEPGARYDTLVHAIGRGCERYAFRPA